MPPARKLKLAPRGTLRGVIQREMNRRKLTGYALAKILDNTSESHLNDWLNGDKSLSDGKLDEILKVLEIRLTPED
ncbi:MAG: helix-turn-helix transcriptional regulator [Planctomycetes bacterium]|nr:helix-turn-helix transcriptional regulator [Planctomycetota bacterium]